MTKLFEKNVKIASALAGIFNASDIVKLLTDSATQQIAIDRLVYEKILPDPRADTPKDIVGAGRLRPAYQAIPFRSRDQEIDNYLGWCAKWDKKLAVRLVTGGSGRGKTRLMVELAAWLRDKGPTPPGDTKSNWAAGFLDLPKLASLPTQDFDGALAIPFTSKRNLCVIVDYAETQPKETIVALLRAALSGMDQEWQTTVRIILIARQKTEFFDTILQDSELNCRSSVEIVEDALPVIEDPRAFFEAACNGLGVPQNARDFPALLTPDCGLLSMAALLAKTSNETLRDATDDQILEGVLTHERRYWERAAKRFGVPTNILELRALEIVAATLTFYGLQGAIPNEEAAIQLVAEIPILAGESRAILTGLVRAVTELYPHPTGVIEGVGLDLLGDHLIAKMHTDLP